jgi:hypothetical protein
MYNHHWKIMSYDVVKEMCYYGCMIITKRLSNNVVKKMMYITTRDLNVIGSAIEAFRSHTLAFILYQVIPPWTQCITQDVTNPSTSSQVLVQHPAWHPLWLYHSVGLMLAENVSKFKTKSILTKSIWN